MKKIVIFLGLLLTTFSNAYADWADGLGYAGGFALPNETPENIITEFLLWILSILAIIGVLAFIISGIMFLTSGGNPEQAGRAKDFVKYSIIGIAVALSGYIIITFIDSILLGYYW